MHIEIKTPKIIKVSEGAKIRNQNRLSCEVGIDPFHHFKTFNVVFPFQCLHVLSMTAINGILSIYLPISRLTASPRLGDYCRHGNDLDLIHYKFI